MSSQKRMGSGTHDQTELLSRYCQEAEELLGEVDDYASALRLRDELCVRFAEECHSPLIVNAAREYLTHLIRRSYQQDNARHH